MGCRGLKTHYAAIEYEVAKHYFLLYPHGATWHPILKATVVPISATAGLQVIKRRMDSRLVSLPPLPEEGSL